MDAAVGTVLAATIVTLPPTAMAALAWIKGRENGETLGKKNGQGSVVEIGEKLLLWSLEHQEQDQERFDEILEEQKRVRQELNDFKTLGTLHLPHEGDSA